MTKGKDETASPDAVNAQGSATDPEAAADSFSGFFLGDREHRELVQSYLAEEIEHAAAHGDRLELLAFWVADEQYALDINEIREIIKVPAITEVPRVGRNILGIVSLRGTIVPILDLRRVLDLETRPLERRARVICFAGLRPIRWDCWWIA